jgi:L-2-hydroxyglutarate oxidase LhgO
MDDVDCIVVGAGAVGLAVARALALSGRSVMVLEQHASIGTEISARNSEVVHAGMYYASGSLKAVLCVRGNALLHKYAAAKGFALKPVGKLIVATEDSQVAALDALYTQSQTNGIPGMTRLSGAQAVALEPELNCLAALHSASTGIVDSHGYMLALQGDIEAAGSSVVCHATVRSGELTAQGTVLHISTPDDDLSLRAQTVINCAGLYATQIAQKIAGFPSEHIPTPLYVKGSYFALAGHSPFKHLIYPMPPSTKSSWLGVHLTLDMGGQARFGPDTEQLDLNDPSAIDYTVNPARAEVFYDAVRQYWRGLPNDALVPAYSGVRPKVLLNIQGNSTQQIAQDFILSTPAQHGVAGVINLFGIESPGLTASLAIGHAVVDAL